MLQKNEPSLTIADLQVSESAQSSIDGQAKLVRLGIADDPALKQEYLEIVKMGQDSEKLMADFLETNSIHRTYKGETYDKYVECGFYVGNPEYKSEKSIPEKATVIN